MTYRLKGLISYAAAMIALAILQMVVATNAFGMLSSNGQDIVYTLMSQCFCMGLVPFVVFMLLKGKEPQAPFRVMRYKAPKTGKVWPITIAIGILMLPFTMVFVGLTNFVLSIVGFTRTYPAGTIYTNIGTFFLFLFLTAVLPAIFEEFTHRGILMSALQDRGSEFEAIVFSAMFFSLMHANPVQTIYTFFGGIVIGYTAMKSGSVFPGMFIHFANNALSVILDYCTQTRNAFGLWYEGIFTAIGTNLIWFGVLMVVFIASIIAVIKLLQLIPKVTKEEHPVQEIKIFGLLSADKYRPDGKATIYDNLPFYGIIAMQVFFTALMLVWGIIR